MTVPFFRPQVSEDEIEAVAECLRSGWLTTGPRVKEFERAFADYLGVRHAVAVNSCTAALHLALEAIGLERGELVLVPTHTFAATAEVVRYFGATPVLVDSVASSLCIDPAAVVETLSAIDDGRPVAGLSPPYGRVRAIIPVHYGGQMADVDAIAEIASARGLSVVDDCAHAFPAGYRESDQSPWRLAGTAADISCFSFYANKCITTGEGGMAVTDDEHLADRMRTMSLHGLSKQAWGRFAAGGSWQYEIVAPGFKYNLTDIAAAIGLGQLSRAKVFLAERKSIAERYASALGDFEEIELPVELENRQHAWHLYPIRVGDSCRVERDRFVELLRDRGITTSVHWKPLHLHEYYRKTFGTSEGLFPVAEDVWPRLISLPIFPGMSASEVEEVIGAVRSVCKGQSDK